MFEIICEKENCNNKDVIYYIPEPTDPTMCGGCKTNLKPIKMSKTKFDKVFDYNPYETNNAII
jgi:hypothetical protein